MATVSATISGLEGLIDQYAGYAMAADDNAVWVYNAEVGKLARIDPHTNKLVTTIPVGHGQEGALALGLGAVWVASPDEGTVTRIDEQTNQVVATVQVASQSDHIAIAVSPGAVWVTDFDHDTLLKIDPNTNRVIATLPNNPGALSVSYGAGSLWLCNRGGISKLARLDPQNNQAQAQIPFASPPCGPLVALDQTIWVMNFFSGEGNSVQLTRIDPATNTASATIPMPDMLIFLAADARGAWTVDPNRGLFHIDPQTNQVAEELAMTGGAGVAVWAGTVWFATHDGTLLRITPIS
jgi:DNA-binding beta-propeller fold protein YncE